MRKGITTNASPGPQSIYIIHEECKHTIKILSNRIDVDAVLDEHCRLDPELVVKEESLTFLLRIESMSVSSIQTNHDSLYLR